MLYLKPAVLSVICCLVLALPGFATAAVPHSFSGGTPMFATEVNTNFSDLDTRATTLPSTATVFPDFSGYFLPFSADGAPKNVVVLKGDLGGGNTAYRVRSRYANSSEQVSIDGVLTIRPFIAHYVFVQTDSGNNITSISDSLETPDTANYVNTNVEQSTYNITTAAKTVTDDTFRELWDLCNSHGSVFICTVRRVLSVDGSFQLLYNWSRLQTTVGPFTVNGMTFPDVRIESYMDGFSRIRAKGIGEVLRDNRGSGRDDLLIYYQVDGASGGSLVGTPFDSGQLLDGLFF